MSFVGYPQLAEQPFHPILMQQTTKKGCALKPKVWAIGIALAVATGGGFWTLYRDTPTISSGYLSPEATRARQEAHQRAQQSQVNSLIGTENAAFCQGANDKAVASTPCQDPLLISVVCDMSQVLFCTKLSQVVRESQTMILWYPYPTTEEDLKKRADYTLMVTNGEGDRVHDIVVLKGHFSLGKDKIEKFEELSRWDTRGSSQSRKMLYSMGFHKDMIERAVKRMIQQKETTIMLIGD